MRRRLDGDESSIFKPGRGWDGMKLKHISWDFHGGKMGSGWRLDANLGSWMKLRCDLVNRWYQACRRHEAWMEVRCKLENCIEVRWDIDGRKSWIWFQDIDGGESLPRWRWGKILGPWSRWDVTWVKVWHISRTWLAVRWGLDRAKMQFLWLECRWDMTWVEVRCEYWELWCTIRDLNRVSWDLDEAHISRSRWVELGCNYWRPGCRWQTTWMEKKC